MGTALALRYELKVATRLGEVIDIAACWADAVVGIVTSTSYVKNDRRVAVHLISSTCHQNSARTTIECYQVLTNLDYVCISQKECVDCCLGAEAAISLHGCVETKHNVAGGTIFGSVIGVN